MKDGTERKGISDTLRGLNQTFFRTLRMNLGPIYATDTTKEHCHE